MTRTPKNLLDSTIGALEELRSRGPLIQCVTNSVVINFTANVLLAAGASPAMVDTVGESGPFATVADAILVNLGTPTREQREGIVEAIDAAGPAGTPWVLDPVAVGVLPVRTRVAAELADRSPSIVRGNASEIMAMAGLGAGGRGVDAADSVDDAVPAARVLAERTGAVVALSGPVDVIVGGTDEVRVANGSPLLTRVTGGGCALGATMAAFAALGDDRFAATVHAVTVYTVAAEVAAERAAGPGSFAVAFLDELARLDADTISSRAVLS